MLDIYANQISYPQCRKSTKITHSRVWYILRAVNAPFLRIKSLVEVNCRDVTFISLVAGRIVVNVRIIIKGNVVYRCSYSNASVVEL